MNTISAPEGDSVISQILAAYELPGTILDIARHGKGHINDTFCVSCRTPEGGTVQLILQGLSQAAFPHPEEVMENFVGITSYLRREILAEGGDPSRETLSLVKTRDGEDFVTDNRGRVWRLMPFIENADCYQSATPELFAASGRAFGRFQYMLRDYPAQTLHETIPHFHDTEVRFGQFLAALEADKLNRVKGVSAEIQFFLARKEDCGVALRALREGKLPLRVTHNDTKLNNILIDRDTHEGICVIDLDTTMPGLSINDFGDSIRFGANHCLEDEQDLSKVNFDISAIRGVHPELSGGGAGQPDARGAGISALGRTADDAGMRHPLPDGLLGRRPLLPRQPSAAESGPCPHPDEAGEGHGGAVRRHGGSGRKICEMTGNTGKNDRFLGLQFPAEAL